MTEDGDTGDGLGVLRSVSVLGSTASGTDLLGVTTELSVTRDIRVSRPLTTVRDVTFAGRLGHRVARRRGGATLTFAYRVLGSDPAPDERDGHPFRPGRPPLSTAGPADADRESTPGRDRPQTTTGPVRTPGALASSVAEQSRRAGSGTGVDPGMSTFTGADRRRTGRTSTESGGRQAVSPPVRRSSHSTPGVRSRSTPEVRSRSTPGVRSRDRWDPTFRRRPAQSVASPERDAELPTGSTVQPHSVDRPTPRDPGPATETDRPGTTDTVGCKSFPDFAGTAGEIPVNSYNRPYELPDSSVVPELDVTPETTASGRADTHATRDTHGPAGASDGAVRRDVDAGTGVDSGVSTFTGEDPRRTGRTSTESSGRQAASPPVRRSSHSTPGVRSHSTPGVRSRSTPRVRSRDRWDPTFRRRPAQSVASPERDAELSTGSTVQPHSVDRPTPRDPGPATETDRPGTTASGRADTHDTRDTHGPAGTSDGAVRRGADAGTGVDPGVSTFTGEDPRRTGRPTPGGDAGGDLGTSERVQSLHDVSVLGSSRPEYNRPVASPDDDSGHPARSTDRTGPHRAETRTAGSPRATVRSQPADDDASVTDRVVARRARTASPVEGDRHERDRPTDGRDRPGPPVENAGTGDDRRRVERVLPGGDSGGDSGTGPGIGTETETGTRTGTRERVEVHHDVSVLRSTVPTWDRRPGRAPDSPPVAGRRGRSRLSVRRERGLPSARRSRDDRPALGDGRPGPVPEPRDRTPTGGAGPPDPSGRRSQREPAASEAAGVSAPAASGESPFAGDRRETWTDDRTPSAWRSHRRRSSSPSQSPGTERHDAAGVRPGAGTVRSGARLVTRTVPSPPRPDSDDERRAISRSERSGVVNRSGALDRSGETTGTNVGRSADETGRPAVRSRRGASRAAPGTGREETGDDRGERSAGDRPSPSTSARTRSPRRPDRTTSGTAASGRPLVYRSRPRARRDRSRGRAGRQPDPAGAGTAETGGRPAAAGTATADTELTSAPATAGAGSLGETVATARRRANGGATTVDVPGLPTGVPTVVAARTPPVEQSTTGVQMGTTRTGSVTGMPTLIQESGPDPGRASLRSETTRARTSHSPVGADWPDTLTTVGGGPAASGAGARAAGSVPRQQVVRSGSSGSRAGRAGAEPGSAVATPGTTDEFPDLDVKRSAPRVDATREESTERVRADRQPEPERAPRGPEEAERAIQEVFFESGTGLSPHNSAVDRIVDKLYREVERRIEIERERRGL